MIIPASSNKSLASSSILVALTTEMHKDRDANMYVPLDPSLSTGFEYWAAWLYEKYQVKASMIKDSSGVNSIKLEDDQALTMLLLSKNYQTS